MGDIIMLSFLANLFCTTRAVVVPSVVVPFVQATGKGQEALECTGIAFKDSNYADVVEFHVSGAWAFFLKPTTTGRGMLSVDVSFGDALKVWKHIGVRRVSQDRTWDDIIGYDDDCLVQWGPEAMSSHFGIKWVRVTRFPDADGNCNVRMGLDSINGATVLNAGKRR